MVKKINTSEAGFETEITKYLSVDISIVDQIQETVRAIITDVNLRGDEAVLELTNKFDNANASSVAELKVTAEEIDAAYDACNDDVKEALKLAAQRIDSYHRMQIPEPVVTMEDEKTGILCGWKWGPIDTVGLYVPGGKAAYPSSVLMSGIPARVSGVRRIVMVVPAPDGVLNPLVLAAAKIAGIDEIYKIGGAQAVAALAQGTETIPVVHKIFGPGNAYVAEAKRQIFGLRGIDTIAGPSEILVVSDNNSNPEWVAADLLSQAEHDEAARPILVTDSEELAKAVEEAVMSQIKELPKKDIALKSWENNGLIVVTRSIDEAIGVSNLIAPEHMELCVDNANQYLDKVTNAGAIFMGRYTPEAVGDYMAGPSHVLPTAGAATFSSGLSVFDFLKKSSIIACSEEGFSKIADATELLAKEEGLEAHARSVSIRTKN